MTLSRIPMKLQSLLLTAIVVAAHCPVAAQTGDVSTHASLSLPPGGYGICFGNSARYSGLRFNWSDSDIEEINGLNFTFWVPGDPLSGTINGIDFGLGVTGAREINGLAFGLGGVFGDQALNGVSIAGLAIIAGLDASGVTISGFGVVASGSLTGFNFGGVGCIAGGDMTGISVGPLGLMASGSLTGVNLGGLGLMTKQSMLGVNFAGLGLIAGERLDCINIAGLAAVGPGGISGVTVAGGAVVSQGEIAGVNITLGAIQTELGVSGVNVAGFRTKADHVMGIDLNLVTTEVRRANGIVSGLYNHIYEGQEGISIGLLNHASVLHGLQIGLVNIADNNPEGLRVLPFVNVHF